MACKYYIKGLFIGDELSLADFLISKYKYLDKFKDLVFLKTEAHLETILKLEDAFKAGEKISNAKRLSNTQPTKIIYGEDGEPVESGLLAGRYKAVTAFIKDMTYIGNDGQEKKAVPPFIDEDYWNSRKKQWENGHFSKTEVCLFFLNGISVDHYIENEEAYKDEVDLKINNFLALSTTKSNPDGYSDREIQIGKYRTLLEHQWKVQGKIGDAVHEAMAFYFEHINSNKSSVEYLDELKQLYADIDQILSHEQILKIIQEGTKEEDKGEALKLYEKLKLTYGDEASFYAEKSVISSHLLGTSATGLHGRLDLVVVDQKGNIHIIDFKTSTHPVSQYSSPKHLNIAYQLGLYARMLSQYGFFNNLFTMAFLPIKLSGLAVKKDSNDNITWQYDDDGKALYTIQGIEFGDLIDRTQEINQKPRYLLVLDNYLPYQTPPITLANEDAISLVNKAMSELFAINRNKLTSNAEEAKAELEAEGGLTPNSDNILHFVTRTGTVINIPVKGRNLAEALGDMIKAVIADNEKIAKWKTTLFDSVKLYVQLLLNPSENDELLQITTRDPRHKLGSNDWVVNKFQPFSDHKEDYELIESDLLDKFLILALYNKRSESIKVFKISTSNLYRRAIFTNNNSKLTGNFISDLEYLDRGNSYILAGVYGNIEAMETMFVLNNLAQKLTSQNVNGIDYIDVINPLRLDGIPIYNDLLLYNYKELLRLYKQKYNTDVVSNDNIGVEGAAIHFNTNEERLYNTVAEILHGKNPNLRGQKTSLTKLASAFEDLRMSKDDKLEKLNNLLHYMELDPGLANTNNFSTDERSLHNERNQPLAEVHDFILRTIAELHGIKYTLQLESYSNYLDKLSLDSGVSGLRIDNPGTLKSDTLNLITKQVLNANLNVRDRVMTNYGKIQKLALEAKQSVGIGYLGSRFTHVASDPYIITKTNGKGEVIYDGMMYRDAVTKDMRLANPWQLDEHSKLLTKEQLEFLKYFLQRLAALRFKDKTAAEIEEMRLDSTSDYYRAPLLAKNNKETARGLLSKVGETFKGLIHLRNSINTKLDELGRTSSTTEQAHQHSDAEGFFEMKNRIDNTYNDDTRGNLLKLQDDYFEADLEYVLLLLEATYATVEEIDKVFPIIKASILHILTQGRELNNIFENELQYIEDYITNKIHNEDINTEQTRTLAKFASKFRSLASTCMLAAAPVQYGYQLIDGIWKGIMLLTRGDAPFNKTDLAKAAKIVYLDMVHYSDKSSKLELLNKLFGMNDMDMNVYALKIKSDQTTLMSLAYRTASRPDYYNRMILLTAQMIHDGTWDAYEINADGNLVYNWKNDARFAAFANDPTGKNQTEEWRKAKGLYMAVVKQMMMEGTTNAKGEKMTLNIDQPMDLPRAYTNLEIMSIKSLGDDAYGYYSHETKSMIHAMWIGALWMQYRTYWSGKKNQYLAHGGIKLRGRWVIDEGVFEKVDPNTGVIELTTEDTGVPHYKWDGLWQEGILTSLGYLMKLGINGDGFKTMAEFVRSDTKRAKAFRANMRLGIYDFIMFAIVGQLLGLYFTHLITDKKKDLAKSGEFGDALVINGLKVFASMVGNSFLDLNWFSSIGGPVADWTPVSIMWASRQCKSLYDYVFDDATTAKVLETAFGAARQNSILLNYMQEKTFGN